MDGWQDLPKGVRKQHWTPATVPTAAHAGPADGLCVKTPESQIRRDGDDVKRLSLHGNGDNKMRG